MARNVKLLLTENVDNLGIVGDVVNVRIGYARNFLLPRGLATEPNDELLANLADKRKQAEKELGELRKQREAMIERLEGLEITMERACNDQGQLYGSVTQQDIAEGLTELGYAVRPREVRLAHTIKRVDNFDVHVKFDSDLEAVIKLHVVPDRELDLDEREEMEFDNEGNLIEKRPERKRRGRDEEGAEASGEGASEEKPKGKKKGAKAAAAPDA
ncbi:MAG: 50S ribosomal protein L9 [Phycisphaerales bacterium]